MKESINDLDLSKENWKNYNTSILTDSLWIFDKRDNSGEHKEGINYPGNFCPQIVNQLVRRYTKKGECVFDPFVGSGTSIIEAEKLGRRALGMDLNPTEEVLQKYGNIYIGDSSNIDDYGQMLEESDYKFVQLIILHPPYNFIIKYSNNPKDLSNQQNIDDFLELFNKVIYNCHNLLENNRYMGLVIGDYWRDGQWIPLGFKCMQEILDNIYWVNDCKSISKFILKSICIKNYGETAGKGKNTNLWKYRALKNGVYLFRHEYIFIFQKITKKIKKEKGN